MSTTLFPDPAAPEIRTGPALFIDKLDEHLAEAGAPAGAKGAVIAYGKSSKSPWDDAPERVRGVSSDAARKLVNEGTAHVLAGTAWLFTKLDETLDAVFVDEAGQLSLLHTTTIAASTSRLVLVGDPQQLAQPSPVQHPAGAHRSPLELVFGGADTLPPDRGVLLPVTRRMHPRVAGFVSDAFYDGLVHPHPGTAHHRVDCPAIDGLPSSGLAVCEVQHIDCATRSLAEAEQVDRIVRALLTRGTTVVDHVGHTGEPSPPRQLSLDDILVVAPYNRQVAALRELLPDGVRVGTVDKFQGQEAAVAIWSVTASSRDDVPRGLDFLLSPNRLNVAVSRARTLAIVVSSPTLVATRCSTLGEMRLVNRLQLFAERATPLPEV